MRVRAWTIHLDRPHTKSQDVNIERGAIPTASKFKVNQSLRRQPYLCMSQGILKDRNPGKQARTLDDPAPWIEVALLGARTFLRHPGPPASMFCLLVGRGGSDSALLEAALTSSSSTGKHGPGCPLIRRDGQRYHLVADRLPKRRRLRSSVVGHQRRAFNVTASSTTRAAKKTPGPPRTFCVSRRFTHTTHDSCPFKSDRCMRTRA